MALVRGQWLENVDGAHLVLTGVTKRTQKFSLSQLTIAKTLVKYWNNVTGKFNGVLVNV